MGHSEVTIITCVLPRDLQNISLAIFFFEIQNNPRKWVVRPPRPHPRHLFLDCCSEGWPGPSHSHSLLGPALKLKQPEINEECTVSTYCVPDSVLGTWTRQVGGLGSSGKAPTYLISSALFGA